MPADENEENEGVTRRLLILLREIVCYWLLFLFFAENSFSWAICSAITSSGGMWLFSSADSLDFDFFSPFQLSLSKGNFLALHKTGNGMYVMLLEWDSFFRCLFFIVLLFVFFIPFKDVFQRKSYYVMILLGIMDEKHGGCYDFIGNNG